METARRRSNNSGCLWAVIILQAIGLAALCGILIVGVALFAASGRHVQGGREMGVDDSPPLTETWSSGQGETKVVRIPVRGLIMLGEEQGLFGATPGTGEGVLASIRRATHDPQVRALILDIDSGGGGITACDTIHDALLAFKASDKDRRVVALLGDVAASGGYYIAAAADSIVAHPTTLTGSIGVLLQTYNVSGLAQKLGIRDETIKSGANKDILNPFHDLTPEQRQMLQDVVNELHARFVGIVAHGRRLKVEDVMRFADGRVFTAQKAVELGLVDQIGQWDAAARKTSELLGVEDVKVYRYERPFSLGDLLKAGARTPSLDALLRLHSESRLLYLWQP